MNDTLCIIGDPNGLASLRSIQHFGYKPENICVWENDPAHIYSVRQISDKIKIINCKDTEFVNNLSLVSMDFTTTIGNPPYMKNVHLEFLKVALLRSKKIRMTQPAGWLFRTEKKIERNVKELLYGRLKKLTFYNGNSVFTGAEFDCPLVIIEAEEKHEGPIEVHYRSTGNTYYVNSVYDMPTGFWEPSEQMLSLVSKFVEMTKSSSIYDLVGKYRGKSFVSSPRTCGHAKSKKPEEFCTNDFFTFFYKNSKILVLEEKNPCYNLNNDTERDSLISYMKTKVARFGLAINKISRDCYVSRYLTNVPLPPLDREWTEESIMDYYKFSDEERQFINSFIPDYYGKQE